MNDRSLTLTALLAVVMMSVGCDNDQPATPSAGGAKPAGAASASGLPDSLLLADKPDAVTPVTALRKSAKVGDTVAVRGYVGGSVDPFVPSRAILTVVDATLANPCVSDDGHCQTPWDYCCNLDDAIANMASVRVTDANGKVVRSGLRGFGGLDAHSEVIVVGKVAAVSDRNLTIDATGLWIGDVVRAGQVPAGTSHEHDDHEARDQAEHG